MEKNLINELLFLLIRDDFENNKELISSMLDSTLDWKLFFRKCWLHGLSPIIYSRINSLFLLEKLNEELREQLEIKYYTTAGNNLVILQQLGLISQLLDNVDYAILKGSAFINILYDNIALRPMCDIDILIRKDELAYITDILIKNGYRLNFDIAPVLKYNKLNDKIYHLHFLPPFDTRQKNLEIHWAPLPKYLWEHISLNKFWDNLTSFNSGNHNIKTLSLENHIIYALFHFAKHKGRKLIWLIDIAYLLKKPNLDVNTLLNLCEEQKLTTLLSYLLKGIKEILNTDLPTELEFLLTPSNDKNYQELFINCKNIKTAPSNSLKNKLFLLNLSAKNSIQKLKNFLKLVFYPNITDFYNLKSEDKFYDIFIKRLSKSTQNYRKQLLKFIKRLIK